MPPHRGEGCFRRGLFSLRESPASHHMRAACGAGAREDAARICSCGPHPMALHSPGGTAPRDGAGASRGDTK